MLRWALIFGALAVVAGLLGFVGLAGVGASVAQALFVVFVGLVIASFVVRAIRGRSAA
jgi:uncharacterized membrane protein YtjA (UPF0391 family)